MGLLTVQERRREGQKNLPNIIRIVSREWQHWIKRGGQRNGPQGLKGIGVKKTTPRVKDSKREEKTAFPRKPLDPDSNLKASGRTEEGLSAKPGEFEARAVPRREAEMDREQRAARIQRIVNTIAERSLAMPREIQTTFIQEEVAKVRKGFRQTYEADPRLRACAMELVDVMPASVKARIHVLETEALLKTKADEGRTEPHS
jgi:hypothetical protein